MSENLSFVVKVRDKGEVTLPIELRERMKLVPGDLIHIEEDEEGCLCLYKAYICVKRNRNKCGDGDENKEVDAS